MTAVRDFDTLLAAYLEDGPTELARASYEDVDWQVARTTQRRPLGGWERRRLEILSRAGIGVAAAVAIGVVGASLLRGPTPTVPGGVGPSLSQPAPSPSPSPTPSSELTAPSAALLYSWVGILAPGAYSTSLSWDPSLVFDFTVGAGWQANDLNIVKNSRMSLAFYPIRQVRADGCLKPSASPPRAISPDDVVSGLENLVTVDVGPRIERIGGREATYVEFGFSLPAPCSEDGYGMFEIPERTCPPAICTGLGPAWAGVEFAGAPQHVRLWLVQIGRGVVAVEASWTDEATPTDLAEVQAVIDSVAIETPLATPPPVPEPAGS